MTIRLDAPTEHEQDTEHPESGMPFFPDFAIREAITAFVFLAALLLVASLTKASLEEVADPSATGIHPLPEWYFLWLFYLLQFFKGPLEIVGTFLMPVLGVALIVSIPFLDRMRPRTVSILPGTRPVRILPRVGAAFVLTGLGALTMIALKSTAPPPDHGLQVTPSQAAGQSLFNKMGCMTCHTVGKDGGTRGPDLTAFGAKADAQNRVLLHFAGIGLSPNSSMPSYLLTPEETRSLVDYLISLKGDHDSAH
ncbi:MAG: c-type cytochrome [Actinomycetota bacterium]